MATNQGQNPDRLVSAPPGTTFGHLVFAHDGTDLYYSVDRTDGSHALARYNLPTGAVAPALWTGSDRVDEIVELAGAPGVALTVGQNCASHRAILSPLDGSPGVPLTTGDAAPPGSATPTGGPPMTVVGRLDRDRFLVAVGGCNAASDLYVVHAATADAAGHVTRSPGVDAATLRQPEPTPPPPLPKNLPAAAVA